MQDEMGSAQALHSELGGMAKGLGEMKEQMDEMMQQKKNGQMDPNALKGLIDSLGQMADMPHADTHIVGTGMNKMYDLRFLSKMTDARSKEDKKGDATHQADDAVKNLARIATGGDSPTQVP